MKIKLLIALLANLTLGFLHADNFSVEDYGLLPDIRSVSISPDGKHYAYIKSSVEGTIFLVTDVETNKVVGGAKAGKMKARSIYFATNEHVIIRASKTRRAFNVRGQWEDSTAIVYNLKTKKMSTLLRGYEDLYHAQSGLGRIVGINKAENIVFMPAYVGSQDPSYSLLRVNLKNGKARRFERGNAHVIDWFVSESGQVLAREEFREKEQEHRVLSKVSGKWVNIYKNKTDIPEISIIAVNEAGSKLIFTQGNGNYDAIYSMSLEDGAIDGPLYSQEGRDIDAIMTDDLNRKFNGVLYSGLLPQYEMNNPEVQANLASIQDLYPSSAISPLSMTSDKSKMIVSVSGNSAAQDYAVFDSVARKIKRIGAGYPNVKKEQIAEIKAIKYKTRDGLSLTAILTQPVGNLELKNLPLIVMPHGGPESYDSIHFDWWAQFLARKGYLVIQPNFRGSTGFGYELRDQGRGKWGKEMQDDLTDAVNAVVKAGYADPDRVCIIGASYGGYAALAGGAFTPDVYRCVVAVAGVSDLPKMLADERRDHGRNHWVVSYWNKVIGNSKTERDKLIEVSPVNSADQFQAPLLMLHGKDDTIVPLKQSQRMHKAMKRAGKQVELITLKGEDHWLSNGYTRLVLLQEISNFLDEHNPVNTE